jgi:STE24 endopeptidase
VATVLSAALVTALLRPRGGLIEAAPVDVQAYFSADQLRAVAAFRDPQRLIGLAGLALSGATLALVALRPPSALRRALGRAGSRPYLGAAAVGAGLSVLVALVGLPLAAVGHERARGVGLATQDWPAWVADEARAAAVGAVLAAGGAVLLIALVRRFPRRWWAPGAAAVVAIAVLFVFISPLVLEPIFNRFTPLPPGPLRSEVLALSERAGVDVGEVFRVDASRRTTGANAYVGGLGTTKRVVLYDNLIESFPRAEVRSVVAHELGHQAARDLPRGLLWIAVVAPAATLLTQRLAERVAGAPDRLRGPAGLPALFLALGLVSFGVTVAGNGLSRQVEGRADAFAIALTGDPAAHIGLERRLAVRNLSDPDPPRLLHLLLGTHPTTVERIGYGVAAARGGSLRPGR